MGGLWLVRDRGEQARRTEAINIADEQLKAESDKGVALNTDDSNKGTAKQAPVEKTPTTTDKTDSSNATSSNATNQPSSATELPRTGSSEVSFVAIGILSFAIASFVHSRKLVSRQA